MKRPSPSGAVADLFDEAAALRRKEVELFRAELGAMASMAATGLGLLIIAAALSLAAVGLLSAAVVAALVAAGWQVAPAALLVAAAAAATAAVAVLTARGAFRAAAAGPRRTVRALARDVAFARESLR